MAWSYEVFRKLARVQLSPEAYFLWCVAGIHLGSRREQQRHPRVHCQQTGAAPCDSRLRSWLHQHGGSLASTVAVREVPGRGHGLCNSSAGTIKSGTRLVLVPWSLIVTAEAAEADEEVRRYSGLVGSGSPSLPLRLWLVLQAGRPASRWGPWLSCLPQDPAAGAPCLPLALGAGGPACLRGTALAVDARRARERLLSEWRVLDGHLGAPLYGQADWRAWLWAQALVSTRSSRLEAAGVPGHVECLVPIIDFANHGGEPNAAVVGSARGAELVALRDVAPGAELCISYGGHDADQFLFASGFLPEDAPLDSIVAPLPPSEALAGLRAELFGAGRPPRLAAAPGGWRALLLALGPPPGRAPAGEPAYRRACLLHLLRFLQAWERELADAGARPALLSAWTGAEPPPEVRRLRARHRAIVAAAISEVEAEVERTGGAREDSGGG